MKEDDVLAFMRGGLFRSRLIRNETGWTVDPPGSPISQETADAIIARPDVARVDGETPPQWQLTRSTPR
jgi:hypothetical protein